MKPTTEQEALLRLSALCAQGEHCQHEMLEKMRRWGLDDEAQARIMERLVAERYVDDERFARAFVNDKIRYQKWGRRKIEQALWQKRIADDVRQRVLDAVDDGEYLAVLQPLLRQKRRSLTAASPYELDMKLVRFALGRGFTMNIIRQCVEEAAALDEEDL